MLMVGLFVTLSLTMLILPIGYLFVDLKKPKAWIIAVILGTTQLGLLGALIFLVTWVNADHDKLAMKISEQHKALDEARRMQNLTLTRLTLPADTAEQAFEQSILYGFTARSAFIDRTNKANEALEKLVSESKRGKDRAGITVLQIPSDTNQPVVAEILRHLGFDAYYAPPKNDENENAESETTDSGADDGAQQNAVTTTHEADGSISLDLNFDRIQPKNTDSLRSNLTPLSRGNVLFIGAKVGMTDTKIVTLALLRAGVEIKHIKRIKKQTAENARTIIIDYKKIYDRRPTLTPDRIIALKRIR